MNRLDLQTPDFTTANIARLAELFPNCVTEKKNPDGTLRRAIDMDLLSQELSYMGSVVAHEEAEPAERGIGMHEMMSWIFANVIR